MNMSAGRRPWYRVSKRDEWNARLPEMCEQRPSLVAVGVERHVNCVSVIESEPVVGCRLAVRADR